VEFTQQIGPLVVGSIPKPTRDNTEVDFCGLFKKSDMVSIVEE